MLFPLSEDLFVEAGTGEVGVGTLDPAYRLDVIGTIRATEDLRADRGVFAADPPLEVTGQSVVPNLNADQLDGFDSTSFAIVPITAGDIGTGAVGSDEILDLSIRNDDVADDAAIAGSKITPNFNGQDVIAGTLGVGILSPQTPFSLRGNGGTSPVGLTQNQVGDTGTLEMTTRDGISSQATRFLIERGSDAGVMFYRGDRGSEVESMRVGGDGRVGIGTAQPGAQLHVAAGDATQPAVLGSGADPQGTGGEFRGGEGHPPTGQPGGIGLIATGGDTFFDPGGAGLSATGGRGGDGGPGVQAEGGVGNSFAGAGVLGVGGAGSTGGPGVHGSGGAGDDNGLHEEGAGVLGEGWSGDGLALGHGVVGRGGSGPDQSVGGDGVYGIAGVAGGTPGYGVFSAGDYGGTGMKHFVQPHPGDPAREIRFVCLEGNESGTYFRGTGRIVGGRATIEVPEEFRLVTEEEGLTVQLTPVGALAVLAVARQDLHEIEVLGSHDVEFHYFANGVRRGFSDHAAIQPNRAFVPYLRGEVFAPYLAPGQHRILVENGTLNPDLTPNEKTAARMGWVLRDRKR